MPLPKETVYRLAKIVGLRLEDIGLENNLIHIRPNPARRRKNKTSERALPLVGYTRTTKNKALIHADGQWLFFQYIRAGHCHATHSSNALSKGIKKGFGAPQHQPKAYIQRPPEADIMRNGYDWQIGGWRSVGGVGARYSQGYGLDRIMVVMGTVIGNRKIYQST